jgi:hypothetical protein
MPLQEITMQKLLVPFALGFMALSLTSFLVRVDVVSVAAFLVSALILAFLVHIEKNKLDSKAELERRISDLESQVSALRIHIQQGF